VITCPKCSKDNQDHYKFCLGCGAELPRDAAPKPFSPQTPPHGMRTAQAAPAGASRAPSPPVAAVAAGMGPTVPQAAVAPAPAVPPPAAPAPVAAAVAPTASPVAAAPAAAPVVTDGVVMSACPQCGHMNGPTNMFCGSCGFRLTPAAAARSAVPAQPAPAADATVGVLLTALRADGTEAGTFRLPAGTTTVGRETGGIFAGDSYLSPRHATFRQASGKIFVQDEESLNGVYKKLARDAPIELKPNDIFRIGQEIIRFEPLQPLSPSPDGVERLGAPSKGCVGRIALVTGRDATGNAFTMPETGLQMGRERGDVLFPEDGYVSGLHCRLAWEKGKTTLTDLGSSNGTFVRLREETTVQSGDVLLMGQQLFRISV
jgi:pSer/pThr/pTyr-binding forkhead associated (FHA) protein